MHPRTDTHGVLLQHQIANELRARITSGELQPGNPVPTTREITDKWQCSKTTAQAAISILRQEGLITGGRGKPPEVKTPPRRQRIELSAGWSQEQKDLVLVPRAVRAQRGAIEMTSGISIDRTHSTHVYTEVPADADLAEAFGIDEGTTLVRRRYEMRDKASGVRLSYSNSYIPRHLIESYAPLLDDSEEPWPGGHQHQLYCVGIEIVRFERTVIAVAPTPDQQRAWGMSPGTPLVCVRTHSVDVDDRVVELSDAEYPADRTEITIREELDHWPADHPRFDPAKGDA